MRIFEAVDGLARSNLVASTWDTMVNGFGSRRAARSYGGKGDSDRTTPQSPREGRGGAREFKKAYRISGFDISSSEQQGHDVNGHRVEIHYHLRSLASQVSSVKVCFWSLSLEPQRSRARASVDCRTLESTCLASVPPHTAPHKHMASTTSWTSFRQHPIRDAKVNLPLRSELRQRKEVTPNKQ